MARVGPTQTCRVKTGRTGGTCRTSGTAAQRKWGESAKHLLHGRRACRRPAGRPTRERPRSSIPVTSARIEVVAVFGPTASGKSAVAEAVAERLGTDVVSADAMQVYRGLPILANHPSRPTRLVGIRGLDEEMSLGTFAEVAHAEIDALVTERGSAVVSGGTGLYLRAAVADLDVPGRRSRRARPGRPRGRRRP